jgi:superfamily II DNA or RNA helicase
VTAPAEFQLDVIDGLAALIKGAAARVSVAGSNAMARRILAEDLGMIVLRAPTGSGKTLMAGLTIESVTRSHHKSVWFWFAPFAALVDQTRLSILESNPTLRPRLIAEDRSVEGTRSGDIFLATWSAVAVSDRATRTARKRDDFLPSMDALVEALRADGFLIGCIVDEAHHSFRLDTEAERFYRRLLRPDVTLLVTATPDDAEINRLTRDLGHSQRPHQFQVDRQSVVDARLNKGRVRVFTFTVSSAEERFVDIEEAALYAGLRRHEQVKTDLATLGVRVTPLLLVQVDGDTGVRSAQQALQRFGVPASKIAVHTAKEPDPDIIAMARGSEKEVLVFKVAVALGFDAPRAFTLVSMRPTRDPDFGTQLLGRLMRVPRALQRIPLTGEGAESEAARRLDEACVFLASADHQVGLAMAAARLQALRSEIKTIASRICIIEIDGRRELRMLDRHGQVAILPLERRDGFDLDAQEIPEGVAEPDAGSDAGFDGTLRHQFLFPLGSGAATAECRAIALSRPIAQKLAAAGLAALDASAPRLYRYPLRSDIRLPRNLLQERIPSHQDDLLECIANRMLMDLTIFQKRMVSVTERSSELFTHELLRQVRQAPITRRKVAEQARQMLLFNEAIDPQQLHEKLLARLRASLLHRGIPEPDDDDLELGLDLILTKAPGALKAAQRECLATDAVLVQAAALPEEILSPDPLDPAALNIYRIFPNSMNTWEQQFAEVLDSDGSGTVAWWHRNVQNRPESAALVMENGRQYFPDFVVGVTGRTKPDGICLAETKRDFASADSVMKNRTDHRAYGHAIMMFLDNMTGEFMVVEAVTPTVNQPTRTFEVEILKHF